MQCIAAAVRAELSDGDLAKIVAKTDGYSGSDMAHLVREVRHISCQRTWTAQRHDGASFLTCTPPLTRHCTVDSTPVCLGAEKSSRHVNIMHGSIRKPPQNPGTKFMHAGNRTSIWR